MHFEFNLAWISAKLRLTGLRRPPCCILRDGGGASPVEVFPRSMVLASCASLCEWMPFLDTLFCFRFWRLRCPSRREILTGCSSSFSSFGHKELKVGRDYRVKVFNEFITAFFDYSIFTSRYRLWLCRYLRMIKKKLGFFVLPLLLKKTQNKIKQSWDQDDFLLMI